MDINAKTRLNDLLTSFPQLEEKIIQAAPAFKNLKNPVLRRTVGRVATVEKVVQIGGLDLTTFINLLRREAGQQELTTDVFEESVDVESVKTSDPDWIKGKIQFKVDGKALLTGGEVPVNKINELLPQLSEDGIILLVTDFEPAPMIEAVIKQKRLVHHKLDPHDPTRHLTFFK